MTNTRSEISSIGIVGTFLKGRACSDTLFHVLSRAFDYPMKLEEQATMPFAGGIMQHGYQCGMVWGATLAAGAQAYRLFGPDPQAEARAIIAAERLVQSFRALNNHLNCLEITDIDQSSSTSQMIMFFLIKGGSIGCFRMAARYAPVALEEINKAYAEAQVKALSPPTSCATVLAQRMGVSEMHAAMVAGFAGGIGLSGGACGALGAATWIISMRNRQRTGNVAFKAPEALAAIDRFVKCTDFEFECSEIVGRQFDSISDHAAHLRAGGCSAIFQALAAE